MTYRIGRDFMRVELTETAVRELFVRCLYESYEGVGSSLVVDRSDGEQVAFSSMMIAENAGVIRDLVLQLPRQAGGTPLEEGMQRNRRLSRWTDSIAVLEMLLLLGVAAGEVACSWTAARKPEVAKYRLLRLSL